MEVASTNLHQLHLATGLSMRADAEKAKAVNAKVARAVATARAAKAREAKASIASSSSSAKGKDKNKKGHDELEEKEEGDEFAQLANLVGQEAYEEAVDKFMKQRKVKTDPEMYEDASTPLEQLKVLRRDIHW